VPVIAHRPYGIEHPYATSPDQRLPVLPLAGETVRLGVVAPDAADVRCDWEADGVVSELVMTPAAGAAADAAALAGGEGHLSEAQAGALASAGALLLITPQLAA